MNANDATVRHGLDRIFDQLAKTDERDCDSINAIATELAARIRIDERTLFAAARSAGPVRDTAGDLAARMLARMEQGDLDPKLATVMDLVAEQLEPDALEGQVDDVAIEQLGDVIARALDESMIAAASSAARAPRHGGARRGRHDNARVAARRSRR